MTDRALQLILASLAVPAVLFGYLALVEALIRLVPHRRQGRLRPWLWLLPGLAFLAVFLAFPLLNTIVLSVLDATASQFVGLSNFADLATDPALRGAVANSLVWIVGLTGITVLLGLALAVLTDRVRYERAAKADAVHADRDLVRRRGRHLEVHVRLPPRRAHRRPARSTRWRWQPAATPVTWLIDSPAQHLGADRRRGSGCSRLLSRDPVGGAEGPARRAAGGGPGRRRDRVAGLPAGSSCRSLARRSPSSPTTMVIGALKAFDIVYVMTNGNFDTEVDRERGCTRRCSASRDFGRASAIAVVLLVAAIVRCSHGTSARFRRQEASR